VAGATGDIVLTSTTGTLNIAGATNTGGGKITLQALGTGALTVNQAISTTSVTAGAPGGNVMLEAGGAITLATGGNITTTGAANTTGAGGAGGEVFINHTNAAAGNITIGRNITAAGGATTVGAFNGGAGGTVTIRNANGSILLTAGAIDVSGGTAAVGPATQGNSGTIQLGTAGTNAAITQTGSTLSTALLAKGGTTGALAVVSATGDVTLTNTTNDVTKVAANVVTAGKLFSYTDANSVTVDTITAGSLTAPSGALAAATTTGIATDGNVSVKVLGGSDLTVLKDILKTGATAATTLTLQADQNIVFNSAAKAKLGTGASGTYTMVLNSDLDANLAGAIQLNDGTVLTSNGGSITLGGGAAGTGASNAVGVGPLVEGVKLDGAQLVSGAGAITIRGTGLAGTTNAHGVSLTTATSTLSSITSTSGPITVIGAGGTGNGGDRGIYLTAGSSIASGSGLITLAGTGNGIGTSNHGIELSASSITSTGTTAIQMTGTGATGSNDILASGTGTIGGSTSSGDILLNGTTSGGLVLGTGTVTLQTTGNVTLNQTGGGVNQTGGSLLANGLRLLGAGAFNLNQTANNVNVLVADLTGATTSLSYRDTNGFSIGTAGTGGLTTAKAAGLGTTTTNGITVGTVGTAANTLTLNAYGAVTQTTSDNVIAGGLQLLGSGPYTLVNSGNNVTTLAANVAGSISYRDTDTFSVGVVADAPSGVSTTGITTTGGNTSTVTLDNGGVMTIAQNISTDGAFSQISTGGAGTVTTSGTRIIATTGDGVSFAKAVTVSGGDLSVDTTTGGSTSGGAITFSSTLAGGGKNVTLNGGNGGNVQAVGAVSGVANFTITNANNIDLAAVTTSGPIDFTGQGTTTLPSTVTSGGAVTMRVNDLNLGGTINAGANAVTLTSATAGRRIDLGISGGSALNLDSTELSKINTTGLLTVGDAAHTGVVSINSAISSPAGATGGFAIVNGTGDIAVNGGVTYTTGVSTGNLTLTTGGGITSNGSALDVSGTLAMNAATGVGTSAALPMVLSHSGGTTLTVSNSTSGGVFVREDLGDLNVAWINNLAPTGAGMNLSVGSNLNINGTIQNASGDVQFVTGNDAAYAAYGLQPASVAIGTLGGVDIKGQVIASNGGAISIYSTGAVTQGTSVAAGLQSTGALNVRTFNSTDGVGILNLQNNLAGSGNSMGPITLEARLAGGTSGTPSAYALSNIDYKSINGTNISGIGTAADFSLVAPSQTINLAPGASLSGKNVKLIATAGDVTVLSAITNDQINGGKTGGSLSLYATGNVVLNNPGGTSKGVVIGKDMGTDLLGNRVFEKFDHGLKLVATGDVRIYGTVEMVGDLALRANAGASEALGSGAAGVGSGNGSVIIAGSAGNPVEVRAKNIVVGVKDGSGNPLPVQNLIVDNRGNSAGTNQFLDTALRADEKLDIYLNGDQNGPGTSGNIEIYGGTAAASSPGVAGVAGKSSALAAIRGDVVTILGVRAGTGTGAALNINSNLRYLFNSSNITMKGGTATSNTAGGGGALAAADALILGVTSKFIDIGGNLVMEGGTADSKSGGQTSAAAKIDPVSLTINTGGYIKMLGGKGAGAPAGIVNVGDIEINIGGKTDYTNADGSVVPNIGLLMIGSTGSGIYDRNNLPIPRELLGDVASQVRVLFPGGGSYYLGGDATRATAFIQSDSKRGFDDSLMAYIIFAAQESARTGRINAGVSAADDSSKPSCN
jgi:hypothetical protein